jgi:tetratricopeptide (TPR) repeat protein
MLKIAGMVVFGLLLAGPVTAAGKVEEEDPALPRPLKGQSAEYYSALANVHVAFNKFEHAEVLQLKAIETEKDRARKERLSFELYERIYVRAGWWGKAAKEILRTIELADPRNVSQVRRYHIDRARALQEAGRADERIDELAIVVRLAASGTERERSLKNLHAALKRHKKLDAKIAEYEATVKKDPKDEVTLLILARIYHGSGLKNMPGKAIDIYKQIRTFRPDSVKACEQLARLYADTNQRDDALAIYEHLLKVNQKRGKGYLYSGVSVWLGEPDAAGAIVWCEKLAKQYPRAAMFPIQIGNLYGNLGKHSDAAAAYKRAIPLLARDVEKLSYYRRLIDAQVAAKQYAEAEGSCREALRLNIHSPTLRRALKDALNRALELQGKQKES